MSLPDSPAETLVGKPRGQLSLRKLVLLLLFSFANFLDVFLNSVLFPTIPVFERSMGMAQTQSTWIMSAFQLTFASFLLISGRVSDVYNPKKVFITGLLLMAIVSLVIGFVSDKIAFIVLRAFLGITGAMLVPSAITLLVRVFPEPIEQTRAIGIFGSCGALGNVLGLFIGAALVQYASYHWVSWFIAIVAAPVALCCLFVIPPEIAKPRDEPDVHSAKWKNLDLVGILILTVALILFNYAVTSGPADGWATARVLVPLIISILLIVGFFYWETLIPSEKAAIPPRTWFYPNFAVLFGSALYPVLWWCVISVVCATQWQDVFHETVIATAAHMAPFGVAAFAMTFTGPLSRVFGSKWIILTGFVLLAVGSVLLAVGGGRRENYWPYMFPTFALGGAGVMLIYAHTNIAIFQATPPSMAGTVGAVFNGGLQLGSAIGLAACNSIEASVEATHTSGAEWYDGRAAVYWFTFALAVIEILSITCFYRCGAKDGSRLTRDEHEDGATGGAGASSEEKSDDGEADKVEKDGATVTKVMKNLPV